MHCQISIFEIKMMLKIGVIFKSYIPFQRYELIYPTKNKKQKIQFSIFDLLLGNRFIVVVKETVASESWGIIQS